MMLKIWNQDPGEFWMALEFDSRQDYLFEVARNFEDPGVSATFSYTTAWWDDVCSSEEWVSPGGLLEDPSPSPVPDP